MLRHGQDENVTINLQKNQGFNLDNVEIKDNYQTTETNTYYLNDVIDEKTRKKQAAEDAKLIKKVKKEMQQDEKERAMVEKKRKYVQQHQEQIDLGFEKPTYKYLMEKKWLSYYDKYDVHDPEQKKFFDQEMEEYSKTVKYQLADMKEKEAAAKKAIKAEEKRKKKEEILRQKKDEEKAKARLEKEYRGDYSEKDGGIIGKYLDMMKQYQDDTGFFHDGVITIKELKEYEDMIHGKQKQRKPFLKEFRSKLVHQMMVDHSFANVMSKYSDDYKMLAAAAQAEEKQLEYTANMSGQDKLASASEKKERERCREELRKLRIAQEDNWRSRVNDEKIAEKSWKKYVNPNGLTDFDSSIYEERANIYAKDVFSSSDRLHVGRSEDEARVDTALMDEFSHRRALKKAADKSGISIADAAALSYQNNEREFDSKAIEETTNKLILATGNVKELTKEEKKSMTKEQLSEHQKKLDARSEAYLGIVDSISVYGQTLSDNAEMKKLNEDPIGVPERYYSEKSREFITDNMYKCDRLFHLMERLANCQMYKKLTMEQVLKFEETCHWLIGYHEWLMAHHKQMKAWDNYFREDDEARKDIPYDLMPRQMEKITHYFK